MVESLCSCPALESGSCVEQSHETLRLWRMDSGDSQPLDEAMIELKRAIISPPPEQ